MQEPLTALDSSNPASRFESFTVPESRPGVRLDTYLRQHYPQVSRGTIQRLILSGDITVNGQRTKPTAHPHAGDSITLHWPPPKSTELAPQDIPLDILFEDEYLLVLNKPPGLVVHPAAGHSDQTLVNALLHHCAGQLSGIGGYLRPGIVHRLDKDTSGCLAVAKTDRAHTRLAEQFAERTVLKVYQAILCGAPSRDQGEIVAAIARHPSHRKRMAVAAGGRQARTSYRVLERFPHASLISATIHTGRTHQIRVHFQHIGCPLFGDTTYGARQNQRLSQLTHLTPPRHMLHAFQLHFRHPISSQPVECSAPRPLDLQHAIEGLRARPV